MSAAMIRVESMYVAARHRALFMADQGSNRDLGEVEVIGDTGKAVLQKIWCHIPESRVGQPCSWVPV